MSARQPQGPDGWHERESVRSFLATGSKDRWPFSTEPGLQAKLQKRTNRAVGSFCALPVTLFACGERYCLWQWYLASPSVICYASFKANRISLWGIAEQYHCPKGNITLCGAKNITHKNAEKRKLYGIVLPHNSLFCFLLQVSHLYNKCVGLCPYPYFISPIRTSPIRVGIFISPWHKCFCQRESLLANGFCKDTQSCQFSNFFRAFHLNKIFLCAIMYS